jgi:hypothetical protein
VRYGSGATLPPRTACASSRESIHLRAKRGLRGGIAVQDACPPSPRIGLKSARLRVRRDSRNRLIDQATGDAHAAVRWGRAGATAQI